jgi:hypothetical protein
MIKLSWQGAGFDLRINLLEELEKNSVVSVRGSEVQVKVKRYETRISR